MKFIGIFLVKNTLLLFDPAVSDITAERYNLKEHNTNKLELKPSSGLWSAFHILNENLVPEGILLSKGTSKENIYKDSKTNFRSEFTYVGSVVSAFGHMIAAMDSESIKDTEHLYISNSDDMTYRIKDIKDWLLANHAEDKELLYKIIELEKNGEEFIDSDIIFNHYGNCFIPYSSDLLAAECRYRLKNNLLSATTVFGGVVTHSYQHINDCYVDSMIECNNIYITLNQHSILEKSHIKVIKA